MEGLRLLRSSFKKPEGPGGGDRVQPEDLGEDRLAYR